MNPGTPGFSPPNAIDTIDHLRAMAGKTLGELAEHVLTTPKTSKAPNLLAYLYEREQEAAEDPPNGLRMVRWQTPYASCITGKIVGRYGRGRLVRQSSQQPERKRPRFPGNQNLRPAS